MNNNNEINTNIEETTVLNTESSNVDNTDTTKDTEGRQKTVSMKFTEDQRDDFNEIREERGESNNYALMDDLLKRYKAVEELSPYNNAPVIENAKNALDTLLDCFERMDKNNAKYVELKMLEFQDRINKYEHDKVDAINNLNKVNGVIEAQKLEISELTKILTAKESEIQEVNGWLEKSNKRVTSLEDNIKDLVKSIKFKTDANDGYVSENTELKENIKNLNQIKDNLNSKIAALEENIDNIVKEKVGVALKAKEEEFKKLTGLNSEKDSRIEELEETTKGLLREIQARDAKIVGLNAHAKSLQESIEDLNLNMNKRIEKEVGEKTSELTTQNTDLTENFKEINDKYKIAEKTIDENSKTIEEQNDKLDANKKEIEALNQKVTTMIKNHQDEVKRITNSYESEIDRLIKRNSRLIEDIMNTYKNQLGVPEITINKELDELENTENK